MRRIAGVGKVSITAPNLINTGGKVTISGNVIKYLELKEGTEVGFTMWLRSRSRESRIPTVSAAFQEMTEDDIKSMVYAITKKNKKCFVKSRAAKAGVKDAIGHILGERPQKSGQDTGPEDDTAKSED